MTVSSLKRYLSNLTSKQKFSTLYISSASIKTTSGVRCTVPSFSMTCAVPQVKHHFLLGKQVVTTRHLGQIGKARGHHGAIMSAVDTLLELGAERRAFRTRSDK